MVHEIHALHQTYGPVVRIGPNEVSFNSLTALRNIYGAGSGFERTKFYHMFDAYGRRNLFTFGPAKDHRERKKLLSHIYSNQTVLGQFSSELVQSKVAAYLGLLEREPKTACEIFSSLHYFSFDTISEFVYGPNHGGTKALSASSSDRALLDDILHPSRRTLAWFSVHLPAYARWVANQTGFIERLVTVLGLMPMKKPFVYSGIRDHALKAFYSFQEASADTKVKLADSTVIGKLFNCQKEQSLTDMDIASECADHLLAGIDTTSDSSMFLIWALSLPENRHFQERLRATLAGLSINAQGVPEPKDMAQLPYLNAVIKETLRLYAPLPTFEPRSPPMDTVIDGYPIPAGTVVGMSPYSLHRDPTIFPKPLTFNPERWLTEKGTLIPESSSQNRYFWAFSSGGRMCIGMHLANAEMTTLAAAIFKRYRTSARHPDTSPGITSRFEIFYDETMPKMVEHECWIDFEKVSES
jgi:Cytochrome P450